MARPRNAECRFYLVWDYGNGPEVIYTASSEDEAIRVKHEMIAGDNEIWPWIVREYV